MGVVMIYVDRLDYASVIRLIKSNWREFVELCGSEAKAEDTLASLKREVEP